MTTPTPTPDRPPLWEVLADAFDKAAPWAFLCSTEMLTRCKAAEIRAMRDWLMPEEPEPEPGDRYEQRHIIWRHNQRLRALLSAEADRAERGDG